MKRIRRPGEAELLFENWRSYLDIGGRFTPWGGQQHWQRKVKRDRGWFRVGKTQRFEDDGVLLGRVWHWTDDAGRKVYSWAVYEGGVIRRVGVVDDQWTAMRHVRLIVEGRR